MKTFARIVDAILVGGSTRSVQFFAECMRKRVCPVYYDRWDYRRREGLNWKVERAILDGSESLGKSCAGNLAICSLTRDRKDRRYVASLDSTRS